MKRYNIKRDKVLLITAAFPAIQLTQAGSLFAAGLMDDNTAQKVLDKWPSGPALSSLIARHPSFSTSTT